jgi:tRNA (guanine-N7-)-methyltransferase
MSRNKLVRFAQNEANPNIIQAGKPLFDTIKGQWNAIQFGNDNPLVVELACGRGEFTVGLGREFPALNFIGVDIKGSRRGVPPPPPRVSTTWHSCVRKYNS